MATIFAFWLGYGPFAGVLALTVVTIASLGKLFSEVVENIDPGPLEALQACGANRLQTVRYAVVPQIVPDFISFIIYHWDINVRISTIIGCALKSCWSFLDKKGRTCSKIGHIQLHTCEVLPCPSITQKSSKR
jgi:hypothetical protein